MGFRKGQSGNPAGRKPGSGDWRTKLRNIIETATPGLIEVLLQQSKNGDTAAIKILLDKVLPNVKPQSIAVNLPMRADKPSESIQKVLEAMSKGEISPDTGNDFVAAISQLVKVQEVADLIPRIEALENSINGGS